MPSAGGRGSALNKNSGFSRSKLRFIGQRARAAPGKSRGIFLGLQHAAAQLEDSALRMSVIQLYRKHNVLDPNGMSEDVAGRRG